jgi:hypothetical protein
LIFGGGNVHFGVELIPAWFTTCINKNANMSNINRIKDTCDIDLLSTTDAQSFTEN